jgi:hypothetical protein
MIAAHSRRTTLAFVSMAAMAAAMLFTAATPHRALADGTRTIHGTVTCTSGIVPFGFQFDWGSGWTPGDPSTTSGYQVDAQTKAWTTVIPSSATGIALDTFCYADSGEYNNEYSWPYGAWQGNWASLTPGTSTVNTTWSCERYPYYYGWVRECTMTAVSYG